MFLRELLEDDDNEEEGDNELGDEELNEMLKRSDEEFEIFMQMDRERTAEALQQWSSTPEGQAGKPLPERLMTVEELPSVYSQDIAPIVFDPAAEEEEEGGGRKARNRNAVHYDDGLTEEQFLEAVENEEDLSEVIAKKRGRRAMRQANKQKKRGNGSGEEEQEEEEEEEDEEDDDFVGNGRGNGRAAKLSRANSSHFSHSPEPNRKRKRILGGSQVGIDDSIDGDSERGTRKTLANKKRRNNAHGNGAEEDTVLASYRKVMRECYQALMKPIAPESGELRINLFMDLVNRKQFVDYYQIIKKPISMKQINKNITSKYKTLKQFKDDVYLMFDNARIYNETESYVYVQADELQDYFDHVFHCLVDENGKPREQPLPQRPANPERNPQDDSSSGSDSESNHDQGDGPPSLAPPPPPAAAAPPFPQQHPHQHQHLQHLQQPQQHHQHQQPQHLQHQQYQQYLPHQQQHPLHLQHQQQPNQQHQQHPNLHFQQY